MRIALLERVASTTWSRQDDADADDDDDGVQPLDNLGVHHPVSKMKMTRMIMLRRLIMI